jgi:hypothetical protein
MEARAARYAKLTRKTDLGSGRGQVITITVRRSPSRRIL